jgi:DNA-directed RNA polymerase subunit RPC12/RpoP
MQLTGQQIKSGETKTRDREDRLRDIEDIFIKCSNCSKRLVHVKRIKEDDNISSNIRASCPFCGDKSFIKVVSGRFAFVEIDGVKITDFPMTSEKDGEGKITQNVRVTVEKTI